MKFSDFILTNENKRSSKVKISGSVSLMDKYLECPHCGESYGKTVEELDGYKVGDTWYCGECTNYFKVVR